MDKHLGDGTFGRALKCLNIIENKNYAVKVSVTITNNYLDHSSCEKIQRKRKN